MYPIKNPAKHLKLFKKELHTKRIIAWNYFPKEHCNTSDRDQNREAFEYISVLNMPRIQKVLNMSEYALE